MKKYWIVGFVVICLCVAVATVFAQTQSYKGTQWEYANYYVGTNDDGTPIDITWQTPTKHFEETFELGRILRVSLWRKAGFNFDDKKPVVDNGWFNFLGEQGWELTCIEINTGGKNSYGTSYWFKRPKR